MTSCVLKRERDWWARRSSPFDALDTCWLGSSSGCHQAGIEPQRLSSLAVDCPTATEGPGQSKRVSGLAVHYAAATADATTTTSKGPRQHESPGRG
ncbi:hypothetical protein JRQ81_015391 [Phrynocephalus forsythii]|uniref:Uncharacterized protein n=1 Tax=Phrynocephalus forsythii TaxID=171643 RepID=A0A9Q0XWG8_9SAUR|nr:hypothetical protein JRQ81_015391 [Phrynocephalus forsythii]